MMSLIIENKQTTAKLKIIHYSLNNKGVLFTISCVNLFPFQINLAIERAFFIALQSSWFK